ncbi:hypothetical protein FSP39_022660 [Pinctada imbricata]|uniref:Uncharacterized protein n=1 Tax=Pinctada imbricata TaxID=66713 RepID=A0AA89BUX2_PINIB|nr:hypothetical protein FSP39_022660 [Pinctada imbricata]
MGTIGVLCQQTMLSFDLGLSLQAEQQQLMAQEEQEHKREGESGKTGRPLSSGSEGEGSLPSPDDKKRHSRPRFFESSWLQKPRRFFKVSK